MFTSLMTSVVLHFICNVIIIQCLWPVILLRSAASETSKRSRFGKYARSYTLKEETFAGRNCRCFAVFCPFRESFFREIFQNGSSAKVSSREMFQNGSSAKVFSRKVFVYFTYFLRGGGGDFSSIFSSRVKKIEKLLINCIFNIKSNKKVNSVFFSDLIVVNPVKVYLREFSKIHYPRKFLPAKYPKIVRTRKFLPAKCKNFAVGPNRESFFPRKFLPLK